MPPYILYETSDRPNFKGLPQSSPGLIMNYAAQALSEIEEKSQFWTRFNSKDITLREPVIKPGALHMLDRHSITQLHP